VVLKNFEHHESQAPSRQSVQDEQLNYCSSRPYLGQSASKSKIPVLSSNYSSRAPTNVSSTSGSSTPKKRVVGHQDSIVKYKEGLVKSFKEDYNSVLENLKKALPNFDLKSHQRYLSYHETIGADFLYSVILDFKDLEKFLCMTFHQMRETERKLTERIEQLLKANQDFEEENKNLRIRLEKLEQSIEIRRDNPHDGLILPTYMHSHYQDVLYKIMNFFEEKSSLIEDTLKYPENYISNRNALGEIKEDLLESITSEDIQQKLIKGVDNFLEIHSKIRELQTEEVNEPRFGSVEPNNKPLAEPFNRLNSGQQLHVIIMKYLDNFIG